MGWIGVCAVVMGLAPMAQASPQFARQTGVACFACHEVPPKLNTHGLAFQASGYRFERPSDPDAGGSPAGNSGTAPLAVWLTSRYEDKGGGGASDLFLPKVELITGGRLGDQWSYFVEWRIVSLSLNGDGTLRDRGGRFEDLFAQWEFADGHALKLGQYRLLGQVDVSLRLSPSDPLLFKNGLRVSRDSDPRVDSLSTFSPSSRSPSIGYTYQSKRGAQPGDGLFHTVTVPFTGEFSIPLSQEASETASFELDDPKGVFLETFYRKGHRSIGAHAFVEDDTWLLTALGTYERNGLFLTAGLGLDDPGAAGTRARSSLEAEYIFGRRGGMRSAAGVRIENVSEDGKRTAYVPYFAAAAPNTKYTYLLQLQYVNRDGADTFVADLSLVF
ncbi:MAG: hypothetical protein ACE5GX_20050 [Thermoanaerobaculia bacterium]